MCRSGQRHRMRRLYEARRSPSFLPQATTAEPPRLRRSDPCKVSRQTTFRPPPPPPFRGWRRWRTVCELRPPVAFQNAKNTSARLRGRRGRRPGNDPAGMGMALHAPRRPGLEHRAPILRRHSIYLAARRARVPLRRKSGCVVAHERDSWRFLTRWPPRRSVLSHLW